MDEDWVELSAAIGVLREQLLAAREAAAGSELSFEVGKVEVELAVEAKRIGGGGVGVMFGVLSIDGKGERSSGATHRVRLELLPRGADGTGFRVAGAVPKPPPR